MSAKAGIEMSTQKIAGGVGISLEADFEKGTWLFAMQEGFTVGPGRFSITPVGGGAQTTPNQPETRMGAGVDGGAQNAPISALGLTANSDRILKRHGITTITGLTERSFLDLLGLADVGRKTLRDIEDGLKRLGLGLAAPKGKHMPPIHGGWKRSADQPPPVGVPVALFTPGYGLEEFVNDGPDVYPDWSMARSWWVALPGDRK